MKSNLSNLQNSISHWKNWRLAVTWLTFQIKITFLPFVHSQIFSAPGFSSLPPWFNNYNQKRRILQSNDYRLNGSTITISRFCNHSGNQIFFLQNLLNLLIFFFISGLVDFYKLFLMCWHFRYLVILWPKYQRVKPYKLLLDLAKWCTDQPEKLKMKTKMMDLWQYVTNQFWRNIDIQKISSPLSPRPLCSGLC